MTSNEVLFETSPERSGRRCPPMLKIYKGGNINSFEGASGCWKHTGKQQNLAFAH